MRPRWSNQLTCRHMRLKDFLRDKVEAILSQWDDFATQLYTEAGLDRASIRDHARGIVDAIAADLARGSGVTSRAGWARTRRRSRRQNCTGHPALRKGAM